MARSGVRASTLTSLAATSRPVTWVASLVYLLDGICLAMAAVRIAQLVRPDDVLAWLVTLTGLAFALAGTVAVRRQPTNTLAILLAAAGPALFAEDLAGASVFSVATILTLASTPVLLHLTLAYPSGQVRSGLERVVVVICYAFAFVGPTIRWTCLNGHVSPSVGALCQPVAPALDAFNVLVTLVVGGTLVHRTMTATPATRRLYSPILATVLLCLVPAILLTLPIGTAQSREGVRMLYHLGLLCVPLAFLLGVARAPRGMRLLTRVADQLRASDDPSDVESRLRRVLSDDSLELYLWDEERAGFVSANGSRPWLHTDQRVEVAEHAGHRVALALRRDSWLDPRVHAAVVRLAALALAHHHAAQDERLRLRRDLHDSAQQQLVATALKLRMAEDKLTAGERVEPETLAELRGDVESSLSQLRRISHGQPVTLAPDLGSALRAIAQRTPAVQLALDLPTDLDAGSVQTAYFVVAEAITNALRHGAAQAITVAVTPWTETTWRVTVTDDGRGSDPATLARPGGGLEGLTDRVRRVGGSLHVHGSAEGVVVDAVLPRRAQS